MTKKSIKVELFLITIIMIVSFIIGYESSFLKGTLELNLERVEMQRYDKVIELNCNTGSMGLAFDCNDWLYANKFMWNEKLEIGAIYIYEKNNEKK